MKRLIPFSNATEAEMWLAANCENCGRKYCNGRRNIEEGFLLGDITLRAAEWIGIKQQTEKYVELVTQCKHKQGYIQIIAPKKKKNEIKNQLKLDL